MNQTQNDRARAAAASRTGIQRTTKQQPPGPRIVAPKVLMLKSKTPPTAPPVYRPQPPPLAIQPRMANATSLEALPKLIAPAPAAPAVYRPQSRPALLPRSQMIQLAPCTVCKHSHGSKKCTVKVSSGKKCGCTSHSGHWTKGSKINPGKGKHARKMAARKG
jgi:hypothetical protein